MPSYNRLKLMSCISTQRELYFSSKPFFSFYKSHFLLFVILYGHYAYGKDMARNNSCLVSVAVVWSFKF